MIFVSKVKGVSGYGSISGLICDECFEKNVYLVLITIAANTYANINYL